MKKNGKFAKRGVSTKAFAMILAVVALVSVTIGGTLAWLTAKTTEVKNTFSTQLSRLNSERSKVI